MEHLFWWIAATVVVVLFIIGLSGLMAYAVDWWKGGGQ